jgi:gliding motility-associated-like protein
MRHAICLLLLCFFFAFPSFAQTYTDGPIQLRIKVRDVNVTLTTPSDFSINLGSLLPPAIQLDEYTFKVWARGNQDVGNLGWLGGFCLTDEFNPPLASVDFDTTIFNITYPGATVPQFFDLKVDAWEDELPSDFDIYGGLTMCSAANYSRCDYNTTQCCINLITCILSETDDEHCLADPFQTALDYRQGPPCQWFDHGFVAGNCPQNNHYQPRVDSYWRYTKGTSCTDAIDLGNLTSGQTITHFNSNECYSNNFPASGGNDVFYTFDISQPLGVTISLCAAASFSTDLYLLDGACTQINFNDNACGNTSEIQTTLCNPGTYIIVVDGDMASDMGTFTLTVAENPSLIVAADAGPDLSVCLGNSIAIGGMPSGFNGFPPYTYAWSPTSGLNAANIPNPIAGPVSTTQYILTVTDSTGCSIMDTVKVSVNTLPTATISTSTNLICTGTFASLTGGGGTTYEWLFNGGSTGVSAPTYTASLPGNYSVVAINAAGCRDTSAVEVITAISSAAAFITPMGPTDLCQGDDVVLTATGLGTDFQWFLNGIPISGATNNMFTASFSGNFSVSMSFSGNCGDTSAVQTVTVNPNPVPTLSPLGAQSICSGSSLPLTASGGTIYQWFLDGVQIPGVSGASLQAGSGGNYYAVVSNMFGCTANTGLVMLTLNDPPVAFASANGPTTICGGGTVPLNAFGGGTYQWLRDGNAIPGATATSLSASQPGQYSVIATDVCGTDTSGPVTVQISPEPVANFVYDTDQAFINLPLSFIDSSINAAQWSWDFGDGFGSSSAQLPVYTYVDPGTYNVVLIVDDINGCKDTVVIPVTIGTFSEAFIPNVFTPNGDGLFDEFVIFYSNLSDIHLSIFDRWGKLLFETSDPSESWDGRDTKGVDMKEGVYYFALEAKDPDGLDVLERGSLMLLR